MRDATLWLEDMRRFAREALALADGRIRDDLDTDRALELQLTHLMLRIGEAAVHVPGKVREGYDLSWRALVGMRNRLVHAYFEVDLDLLWQAVEDSLPALAAALESPEQRQAWRASAM